MPRSWRSATRRSRRASSSSSEPDPATVSREPGAASTPIALRPRPAWLERVDRSAPVWVLAAAALVLLILLPLAWLVYMSVQGDRGGFTLAQYARVFGDPRLQKALWNTVVLAFWSGIVAVAIGTPMAWLTARTDLPWSRAIRSLVMASFVTPPFLGAFAWVMLAGPNAGYLNKLYRGLTGAEEPLFNIFTMTGLIFVVAIYTFPYVYIMIANTLGLIASDLEEAAAILGAHRLQVALTVTLPMVLPAILSGFILAVLQALALFGSPAILALPAGFQYPPKVEMAAACSVPLLLSTALLLLAQKKLLGRRGYASVGGKGAQRRIIPLGVWRYPALAGCLAVLACAVFLPYGVLARAAFSRAWAEPLTWDNFTLANWSFTFLYSSTQGAIVNTLELGVLTACVGAGLAALLAYITTRKLVVGHQLLAFLTLAPVVIPGIVLAVALFIAYTRPPFLLYGTLWILFIAYLTKEIPVGYSQSDATFRGIHPELEEAGRILGAGRLRVLGEITAPLAKSGIIATWCFIFIGVIRELSASIILFTPSTKVMSVVIFDLKEEGQFGAIAVLGLFMLAMTFAIVALMQGLLGRDVLGGRSSTGASG